MNNYDLKPRSETSQLTLMFITIVGWVVYALVTISYFHLTTYPSESVIWINTAIGATLGLLTSLMYWAEMPFLGKRISWLLPTITLSWTVGSFMGSAIFFAVYRSVGYEQGRGLVVAGIMGGAVVGAASGVPHWLVSRTHERSAHLWVIITALSWALAGLIAGITTWMVIWIGIQTDVLRVGPVFDFLILGLSVALFAGATTLWLAMSIGSRVFFRVFHRNPS